MAFRGLFVLRMAAEHADAVSGLFAEHDRGDMPHVVGITRRTLFRFHDLYLHLIEADSDVLGRLEQARGRDDFQRVNSALEGYLRRYDPEHSRTIRDSMATPFYTWSANGKEG